jgi:hypothetical protein
MGLVRRGRQPVEEEIVKQIVSCGAALAAAPKIKRLALAVSVVAALASAPAALAGGTLPGDYRTTITSPPAFKGTWVLKFAKGGAYAVLANGKTLVRGKYTTTGSSITFGHETGEGACAKTGKYTWKKSGKTLRFTRTSDSALCSGREGVLAHVFTQQH